MIYLWAPKASISLLHLSLSLHVLEVAALVLLDVLLDVVDQFLAPEGLDILFVSLGVACLHNVGHAVHDHFVALADAGSDAAVLAILPLLDVLVHLEEDDLEGLLLLQEVQDLEILLVESCFRLHDDWAHHAVRLLVDRDGSCHHVGAEDSAQELLNSPDDFQEEQEDVLGA